MEKQLKQLMDFNKAFGFLTNENPNFEIHPDAEKALNIWKLRIKLMQEELNEVVQAKEHENMEALTKELCDLLYVVYGTILSFGLQNIISECFDRVHESNMSKLTNGVAVYREDGKLMKGPNYKLPNFDDIFKKYIY